MAGPKITDPPLEGASAAPRAAEFGPAGNRFDRMEWAGAFGDLGTLIPFVVAYISLLRMDPYGILFGFGVAKIASGLCITRPRFRSSR